MPEQSSPRVPREVVLRAVAEHNYTAQRTVRALEVIVLHPSGAPAVAAELGVHPRTARRILQTLTKERYVERRGGRGRTGHTYLPTVRLLAMAAQLAPRLPLVQHGARTARELELKTDLTAYLAVPCYAEVLVIACTGERAMRPWATLPAVADATGHVLFAHRQPWRESQAGDAKALAPGKAQTAEPLARGHAILATNDERSGSLAVAIPDEDPPIAALGFRGPGKALLADEQPLADLLHRTATSVAEMR